jgi:hypothetical protein
MFIFNLGREVFPYQVSISEMCCCIISIPYGLCVCWQHVNEFYRVFKCVGIQFLYDVMPIWMLLKNIILLAITWFFLFNDLTMSPCLWERSIETMNLGLFKITRNTFLYLHFYFQHFIISEIQNTFYFTCFIYLCFVLLAHRCASQRPLWSLDTNCCIYLLVCFKRI